MQLNEKLVLQVKIAINKVYSAIKLSFCLWDTSVTCPDRLYPSLKQSYKANKAKWLKNLENSK